jgi:hypothetical protein
MVASWRSARDGRGNHDAAPRFEAASSLHREFHPPTLGDIADCRNTRPDARWNPREVRIKMSNSPLKRRRGRGKSSTSPLALKVNSQPALPEGGLTHGIALRSLSRRPTTPVWSPETGVRSRGAAFGRDCLEVSQPPVLLIWLITDPKPPGSPWLGTLRRQPLRNSFSKLWVRATRSHSAVTFNKPRNENRRKPRTSLI